MTWSEKLLWEKIRNNKLWIKILRQKPIYVYTDNNNFHRFIIADFYISINKLIIEIDWSVHLIKDVLELDKEKEKYLEKLWYRVIRFTNNDIFNDINNVLFQIQKFAK